MIPVRESIIRVGNVERSPVRRGVYPVTSTTRSVAARVKMPVGASYHFKYLAEDGAWFCDPDVAECQINEYGEMNSLLQLP